MIRPQYFFRSSAEGLLAWDVRRLISLSQDFPVKKIRLTEIAELDENHWYAESDSGPTCRSIIEHCTLIAASDLSFPIILDQRGRVMDGMHRVCKAVIAELTELPAVQFQTDPEPDYVDCNPDDLPYDD